MADVSTSLPSQLHFLGQGRRKKGVEIGQFVWILRYACPLSNRPLFYISYKHLFVRYKNEGLIAVSSEICNERSPPQKTSASKSEKTLQSTGFSLFTTILYVLWLMCCQKTTLQLVSSSSSDSRWL